MHHTQVRYSENQIAVACLHVALDYSPAYRVETKAIFRLEFNNACIALQDAMLKRKECEKMNQDHKMDAEQYQESVRRTDVISYALMAEINHFHEERCSEVRKAMKSFLGEQVAFYQKVSNCKSQT